MECKYKRSRPYGVAIYELIDTLWNVNNIQSTGSKEIGFELIDTLWNVNRRGRTRKNSNLRINRYIMECKFIPSISVSPSTEELIDTLWNVNVLHVISSWGFRTELIDTLWNVNPGGEPGKMTKKEN